MTGRESGGHSLRQDRRSERRVWLALSIFIVVALIAAWRYQGPSPSDSGDELEVSSRRALSTLGLLLGEGEVKHPSGTRENDNFRVRLVGMLSDLGLEISQLPFTVDRDPPLACVNLLARVPGKPAARPIVIATHYDSCRFGPGAGDAGQCVAGILEMLRVLQREPLEHELWVLMTDAEEAGLLGANELVTKQKAPWGDAVPVVINFDARGDRGAVLLYETHVDNLAAMRVAAQAIAHPQVTTSLMVNVYEKLPNKTDYTVFRKAGWPGWNFAVIGGAENYHTPEDNLEHLSPRSIKHFAAHGLSLVRALDRLDEKTLTNLGESEPAVFFDFLGWFVVVVPRWTNWILLTAAVGVGAAAVFVGLRHERLKLSRVVFVVGTLAAAIALAAFFGWFVSYTLKITDLVPRRFVVGGEAICLVYAAIGGLLVVDIGRRAVKQASLAEALTALGVGAILVGALASLFLPGGAYLGLLPGLGWSLMLLVLVNAKASVSLERGIALAACTWAALFWSPTYVLLAQALGPLSGTVLASVVAAILSPTVLVWALKNEAQAVDAVRVHDGGAHSAALEKSA